MDEISYDDLLLGLKDDRGWIEVIDAYDPNNLVRAFLTLIPIRIPESTYPLQLRNSMPSSNVNHPTGRSAKVPVKVRFPIIFYQSVSLSA